jgi:thioredoxin-like negative regulator of GroEL
MISKNKNLKGRGTWAKNPDGVASLDERLEHFLSTLKIPERLTVADIKDIVWNESDHNALSRLAFFVFEGKSAKEHQAVLDILQEAWNFFPHRSLNGLSPNEMVQRMQANSGSFSPDERRDFYEIFAKRFPPSVRIVREGKHEWQFEHPSTIQTLRETVREFDKINEEVTIANDEFDSALAVNYAQIMDIIESAVKKEPLFFEGAIRLAHDEFTHGDEKEAKAILKKSIESARALFPHDFAQDKDTLPWGMLDNRPFLLLLGEYATLVETIDGSMKALPLYEELLALNPGDNQGIRSLLATAYLKTNQLEKLSTLSEKYPDDMMQELVVGNILALYKQGKYDDAKKKILNNTKYSAHVFREILKVGAHPQPELTPGRVRAGGDDEAWLYWQAQGNFWMTTSGAREFLKETLEPTTSQKNSPKKKK